jgi:hypothetical protein
MNSSAPFFLFSVVGAQHVEALRLPLAALRRHSDKDIVVVQGRSSLRADAAFVVDVELPASLTDHQASIWLKTSLPKHLARNGLAGRQFCYLDSDVIALTAEVNRIFDHQTGPVAFAADHASIDRFSHWAVDCGCQTYTCNHLRETLLCEFGVDVLDPCWTMWNGGVFVADNRSADFFDMWHYYTNLILKRLYWRTRDQATLATTVWRQGLQSVPLLPQRFNYILDCLAGVDDARRHGLAARDLPARPGFEVRRAVRDGALVFLHLINQGAGRTGWRHWDEVSALLST